MYLSTAQNVTELAPPVTLERKETIERLTAAQGPFY